MFCNKEINHHYDHVSGFADSKLCFECFIWHEHLETNLTAPKYSFFVTEGKHFRIGDENGPKWDRGFGGHKFIIQFDDGHEITTSKLWGQGKIPDVWLKLFPDNAKFVKT